TRFALSAIARRAIQRRGGEARRDSIQKTVRPFGLVAGALTWVGLLHIVGLPAVALSIVLIAVRLFAMLAIVWAAFRLTDLVSEVFLNKAEKTESRFDDLLIPLVRKAVKVLIFVFGIIFVGRSIPGANLTPLFTGIGIGGAGFAFAAKDTLEHFFGSLTVLADRPFQVGDWVQIGEVEGTVEEVGFRSTRIRTFYNSLITLPNGNLVRAAVDNYGQRKYRRWSTHLNLTYDTPPDKIEAFCEGVRELIRVHPYTRKDYYQVWLHKFGAHSLDVLLYVFHEAPDWQTELRERHRLAIDIIRLANRLGVEFAFPTQTIHLGHEAQEPVTLGDPPANADGRAGLEGRKAVRELTQEASWRREKPGPYKFEFASHADADDETQIESKPGGQDGGG
ncbi:MAG: mechanosensitive ion channel family protein, partial [Planctomycetota bacterium]